MHIPRNVVLVGLLTISPMMLNTVDWNLPTIQSQQEVVNLFPVEIGGRWGYIDTLGTVIINPQFDRAYGFSEGLAHVTFGTSLFDQRSGFINSTGQIVINPNYKGLVMPFTEGFAAVGYSVGFGDMSFIDKNGRDISSQNYDMALFFSEGLASVMIGRQWGYINSSARMVIQPQFAMAGKFQEGLARADIAERTGFIDKTGAFVINPQFEGSRGGFSNGIAVVMWDGKWGAIDKTGNFVIEAKFDSASYFSEGLAPVAVNGKWRFIDESGGMVIEPQFETVSYGFINGLAIVRSGSRLGYIDKTGHFAIQPQFYKAVAFEKVLARVDIDESIWGYIKKNGEFIWRSDNPN